MLIGFRAKSDLPPNSFFVVVVVVIIMIWEKKI